MSFANESDILLASDVSASRLTLPLLSLPDVASEAQQQQRPILIRELSFLSG